MGYLAARHFESVVSTKGNGSNGTNGHNNGSSEGGSGELMAGEGEEGEREQTNGAFAVLTALKVKIMHILIVAFLMCCTSMLHRSHSVRLFCRVLGFSLAFFRTFFLP